MNNSVFNKVFSIVFILIFTANSNALAFADSLSEKAPMTGTITKDAYVNQEKITDEFAKNISVKEYMPKAEMPIFKDSLVTSDFVKEYADEKYQTNIEIKDIFASEKLKKYEDVVYRENHFNYLKDNFKAVKIKSKTNLSTKNLAGEGQIVEFYIAENVKVNGKIVLKKGTPLRGRVETISQNDIKGVPADLIVGSFQTNDIVFVGQISKTGANRFYWVIPVSYVTGFLVVGMGYLIDLIRGGHAKINKKEVFEIFLPISPLESVK